MSRRRFYAPPESFAEGGARLTLSREESQHLTQVLRLGVGAEVYVFDGAGREFLCAVADVGRRGEVMLEVRGRARPPCAESPLELVLAAALLKGEKFDLIVQKATELGVVRLAPILSARTDVRLPRGAQDGDGSKRLARWRRIAVEAAKQSGRARVPEVCAPVALAEMFSAAAADDMGGRRLIFAERDGRGLLETVGAWSVRPERVIALVGPEGGWEEAEIEGARRLGWEPITLGGRTLRAETACVVAVALLQHLCGDLS